MGLISLLCEGRAATISSRTALNVLLGGGAVTEDFERYIFPTNTSQTVGATLDPTTVLNGQGPGLIQDGLKFTETPHTSDTGLQWDRQFQYGLTSAGFVSARKMLIDFTKFTTAVGFDMFWYDLGWPWPLNHPCTIQVYATNRTTLLYSTNIYEPFAPEFVFFAYTDSRGIGRITLWRDEDGTAGVSSVIDNLTFDVAPKLSMTASNSLISLSWPQVASGFKLESSILLGANATWTPVTNAVTVANGRCSAAVPQIPSGVFFRLRTP